ncbi:MAG: hypothetical protein R3321_01570 [Nitrososphaeraceae archaeon]|nr:hypothetical protein [Nitrososphaeraceae archaeon]
MFNSINWQNRIPSNIYPIVEKFVNDVNKFDEDHPYDEGLEWFEERCNAMYTELDKVEYNMVKLIEQYGAYSLAECAAMALELC